jgi:hypothetical protein
MLQVGDNLCPTDEFLRLLSPINQRKAISQGCTVAAITDLFVTVQFGQQAVTCTHGTAETMKGAYNETW